MSSEYYWYLFEGDHLVAMAPGFPIESDVIIIDIIDFDLGEMHFRRKFKGDKHIYPYKNLIFESIFRGLKESWQEFNLEPPRGQ